ncbi:MAG: hypothetical protein JWM33_3870, partial [Caulobacteraceae bacterium]|nr:hypothetical protein [Caulobacteraceae bacterium]
MSVLTLMYHRTPLIEAGHILDVPMPLFRRQVLALRDAGFRFMPFSQINRPEAFGNGPTVSLTFDDGHESNVEAFRFLHDEGVACTSFFVRDYVRDGKDGFMGPEAVAGCSHQCEVGAHGATHSALSRLS